MSRFLHSLSSLMNGHSDRSRRAAPAQGPETEAGPSTLTTPLIPLNGADADAPAAPPSKVARKSSSSRALNAVVRATTQVALPTHVEPAAPPKATRAGHRSGVALTETERLRLQIMQVQLKLTGLGLYEGTIDGMMNPELVEGVRHFQTLKGMRDSGLLTSGTLTALGIRTLD
jgi:hypothetical protein